MRRSLVVLILVSMTAIAALTLVSFGLSYAQAMKQEATFMNPTGNHMSQYNHNCGEDMSNHMNMREHMRGVP